MPTTSTLLPLRACSILLFVLAWGGIAWGSFQYDDFANILTDPATFDVPALMERLAHGIRPLTRASYAVSALLFGEWAGGWLLINGSLHALTAFGVSRLTFLRTRNQVAALAAGLCFALQPVNAMIVAYVSGRSTGLATALLVLALLAHERAVSDEPRALRWQLAALLAFVCACVAKEIAVVFPALVWVWELTRSGQSTWRLARQRTLPYVAAALLCAAFLLCTPRYRELIEFSLELRPPLAALLHNLAALPLSFSLWFRPWALSVEHATPSHWGWVLIGIVMTSAALLAGLRMRHSRPLWSLALLWSLVAMAPTHSVIAKLDVISEGTLYLAWIGPSIAIGAWIQLRASDHRFRALALTCSLVFAMLCAWRVHVWSDPVLLWREAVATVPESSRAWTNLGMAQMNAKDHAAARTAFRTALDLDPTNARVMLNLEILAALNPHRSTQPQ